MALSSERYVKVNAELKHMQARLMELAAEIDAAAPMTDKQGFTYQFAQQVGEAVAHLRAMLKKEMVEMGTSGKIHPRLYAKHKQ